MHSVSEGSQTTAVGVAVRILGGEKAGEIKTPPSGYAAPKFDWRQLQRWGIAESRLPRGSQVYFREPSRLGEIPLAGCNCRRNPSSAGHADRRPAVRAPAASRAPSSRRASALPNSLTSTATTLAGELTTSIAHELNQPLGSILVNTDTADADARISPSLDVFRAEGNPVRHQARRPARRRGDKAPAQPAQARAVRGEGNRSSTRWSQNTLDLMAALGSRPRRYPLAAHLRAGYAVAGKSGQYPAPAGPHQPDRQRDRRDGGTWTRSQRKIVVRTARNGDSAEVEIADTGPGIMAGKLNEVFEPFYTTKPQRHGHGTVDRAHHYRGA